MAELSTLARPYAKAAFQYAADHGDLAGWSTQLGLLAAIAAEAQVIKVISSPSLTSDRQAQAIIDVCGDQLTAQLANFVKVLAENKRLLLLPQIYQAYEALKAAREKSVDVEIATAFELDSDVQEKLSHALSSKLEREIKVNTVVDKHLLGGVLVRAGDIVIDGSVRGRLDKLAASMNL